MQGAVKTLKEYSYLRYELRKVPSEKIKALLKLSDEELRQLQEKYRADVSAMSRLLPNAENIGADFFSLTDTLYCSGTLPCLDDVQPEKSSSQDLIQLSSVDSARIPKLELLTAIQRRRTTREFSGADLPLSSLATMLWGSHGLLKETQKRVTPSAGGLYPVRTYLFVRRVADIPQGVYQYDPLTSSLSPIRSPHGCEATISEICFSQQTIKNAAAVMIWTGQSSSAIGRYGQRGYRHMLIEVGHICQNLYLCSQLVDCGVCAVSAFADLLVDAFLDLKTKKEVPLYMAAIGPLATES